jgi:hypothetical protein
MGIFVTTKSKQPEFGGGGDGGGGDGKARRTFPMVGLRDKEWS